MPETAQTYANMLKIQAAQGLAGHVVASKSPLPVIVAPKTAPKNINLSNFTPAQHAHLAAVAAAMRPRKTELELSYNALKKAENTGKKRTRRTRKTTCRTRRGKRT
jgi:hypothetical protein